MSLADLTSAAAVRAAIDEFDELGREEFLRKYGFGPARRYVIRVDGRLYDSKAIVGVAHGFQHPELGPLKHDEFAGGETTTKAKLEELGFEVVTETRESTTLHLVVKWSPSHGRDTVDLHREVADGRGSVWWGLIGKPGSKKLADASLARLLEQLADGVPTFVFISGPAEFPGWRTLLEAVQEQRPCGRGAHPFLLSQRVPPQPLGEAFELRAAGAAVAPQAPRAGRTAGEAPRSRQPD